MTSWLRATLVVMAFGCAPSVEVGARHPARPDGPEAALAPPSRTLAPDADVDAVAPLAPGAPPAQHHHHHPGAAP